MSRRGTTVSTAKPSPPNNSLTVGDFMAGSIPITASKASEGTLTFTSTLPRASSTPCSSVWIWPMAWALSGSAKEAGLAISSV